VPTTFLKSLQALELAVREGSLKAAADRLGITAAAVGQRIRALEEYLGADLLARGRSGLIATPELQPALADLRLAFAALERVSEALDLQRETEIHVIAETDWADLWLMPRLPGFRAENPHVRFCVNGVGDVPMRLGAPDIRVERGGHGTPLYHERMIPLASADIRRRIPDEPRGLRLAELGLIHLEAQGTLPLPGWHEWLAAFGGRSQGIERGPRFHRAEAALAAARASSGPFLCGLSLALPDIEAGTLLLVNPATDVLVAADPYRLWVRPGAERRPQQRRFVDWLASEARETEVRMDALR
jgi:LysR family glycine cleavage system transcriptional activator